MELAHNIHTTRYIATWTRGETWNIGTPHKVNGKLAIVTPASIICRTMENNYLGASNFPHMGRSYVLQQYKWGSQITR